MHRGLIVCRHRWVLKNVAIQPRCPQRAVPAAREKTIVLINPFENISCLLNKNCLVIFSPELKVHKQEREVVL